MLEIRKGKLLPKQSKTF